MKNYYRILGIGIDAENEEIKAAYRILAQRFHPDKGGDPTEFRMIQEAYDILSNPLTKRSYDRDFFSSAERQMPVVYHESNATGFWVWVVAVLTITCVGFVGYIYWQQHKQNKTMLNQMMASQSQLVVIPSPAPQPVAVNKKSVRKQKPVASTPVMVDPLANLSGTNYLINIGSYTTLNSAASKQASLKKLGFNSSVQKINANSEGLTSYNVFMGPYRSQSQAYNIQAKLESQNLSADVERVDSE